jgi:transposase-like protein
MVIPVVKKQPARQGQKGKTMTERKSSISRAELKQVLMEDADFLRPLMQLVLQEVLEAEMDATVGAGKGERTADRRGYRSGYYTRTLITRVGRLELRIPQDRQGQFSTEIFERYQRSEKALVTTLAEMYIQGVSTRKVKAVTEELCGHAFSAATVSALNVRLDEELARFAGRTLEGDYPYLILDARYEKVRVDGVIRAQAVLVAIGINWEGRREVLGVELANRESQSSWKDFLVGLRQRGLRGVGLAITDDHSGLKKAVVEVFPEAAWQRCYVHFLRNALDYLPRKADDDCLMELRWLYDRRSLEEARRDLAAWLAKVGSEILSDVVAPLRLTKYMALLQSMGPVTGGDPNDWKLLRELCSDLVALRKGDHSAERLKLERDRWSWGVR